MATLTTTRGRALGELNEDIALGPVGADANHQDLATAKRFTIGEAGDAFVATGTGQMYLLCGDNTVTATTSSPVFDPGVKLTLPDGCTHVSLLAASTGVSGCAYLSRRSPA